ncbi:MAG: hypothetical protein ACRC8S_12475 [Fimbriiglobus sp.]
MMGQHGHDSRFSFTIGEDLRQCGSSRRVDVAAAGRRLTCADNNVNTAFFAGRLEHELRKLLSDPQERRGRPHPSLSVADNYRRLRDEAKEDNTEYLSYRFMDWGPTADNVAMLMFRENGTVHLPFSFVWPDGQDPSELGKIYVAELPEWELAMTLHNAAWELMWGWAVHSK